MEDLERRLGQLELRLEELERGRDPADGPFGRVAEGPWLTKAQAAELAQVSISTVDRAIRNGELRAGGTDRLVRVRRDWAVSWLESRSSRR